MIRRGASVSLCLSLGLGLSACKDSSKAPAKEPAPELVAKRPSDGPLAQMPALLLPDDPARPAKVALGRALFVDKRLSGGGERACDACHQDGQGGRRKELARRAPALWNVGYYVESLYWDGRAATLEDAVKAEWSGPAMGAGPEHLDAKAAELAALPEYKKLFVEAFGDKTEVKAAQVAAALGEYMRTLVCTETAYDRFARGEKAALTEPQQRGFDVFAGKGGCVTCHTTPYFTTAMGVAGGAYFNTGIGTSVPESEVDVGRMKVTGAAGDWAAFRPPSLRNVTRSAPYFHDGSVASLDEAVRLMARGGIPNKNRNPALADRALSDAEVADVIAFLGALDCSAAP